jgi:hypothetical protein
MSCQKGFLLQIIVFLPIVELMHYLWKHEILYIIRYRWILAPLIWYTPRLLVNNRRDRQLRNNSEEMGQEKSNGQRTFLGKHTSSEFQVSGKEEKDIWMSRTSKCWGRSSCLEDFSSTTILEALDFISSTKKEKEK